MTIQAAKTGFLVMAASACLLGCINNPLAEDQDGDGFMAGFDVDCSDEDPSLGPRSEDADCDGALTAEDCDDEDPQVRARSDDRDCDGSVAGEDCDDGDPANFPGNTDAACDGFDTDCVYDGEEVDDDVDGQWECQGDCDDGDPQNFGGNTEVCDGQDNDCNGIPDAGAAGVGGQESDSDGDGQWECEGDCDDEDPVNFDGNPEACDGQDNDCNGLDDAGAAAVGGQESDDDGDGQWECEGDCDDADPMNFVGNPEACDGQDNDCNGLDDADAAVGGQESDDDGDGQWECQGDCDDADPMNFGGNSEACDGRDNDCNGLDDAGAAGVDEQESDADGDGQWECEGDCDDADPANFDGNAEACDGQDNDCDGLADAGAPGVDGQESDDDGDGQWECQGDCDDTDPTNFDGNLDAACDGLDTDCETDGGEVDDDGDGQWECQGDCDDTDPANFAGNFDAACDGFDTDCVYDGEEVDDDFDGQWECQGDCDDLDPLNFAGNTEACDGQDNDCNGLADAGAAGIADQESDTDGDGQWECQGDCDDTDPLNFSGNTEACDGQDNDCNGLSDAGATGVDGQESDSDGDEQWGCQGDCNDGDVNIYAGNWLDPVGDLVDSNCDGFDWYSLGGADAAFVGQFGGDHAGFSVSSAGDVDGDGLDDLLIGAPDSNSGGSGAGASYLMFGRTVVARGTYELSTADAVFVGEHADDSSGHSVSSAGDVDGDGLDDLLIGAPNNGDGGSGAGKSYLFFGRTVAGGGTFYLSSADAAFVGESQGDYSGGSVSSAGDVDGDGFDDVVIGADNAGSTWAGRSYLYLGTTVAGGGTFDLSQADATLLGEVIGDRSGHSVSSAGDVDGDGLDDLLIGAVAHAAGGAWAGKSYLVLGSTVAGGGAFDLSLADAAFIGEATQDQSGSSVSSAGDVDGDGLDDLLIGAYGNADAGTLAGKSYLFLASTVVGGGTFDLSLADAAFVGESQGDYSGISVSSAGDVDGDGLDDLLIGAGYARPGSLSAAGKSYLLLGGTVSGGGTFDLSLADAAFGGENILDASGWSVSSAGDVDGDGLDDLLIGAYRNSAGKAYLLLSPF